jgi:hypothetical protein
MRGKLYWACVAAVCIVGAIGLNSCRDTQGGGWAPVTFDWPAREFSNATLEKATIAFQMNCKDKIVNGTPAAVVNGQLQYNDHKNQVQFHGTADNSLPYSSCATLDATVEDLFGVEGMYIGTYTPQGKSKGEPGSFLLAVDKGSSFCGGETCFALILDKGAYSGYVNWGPLGKGNIQVK